MKQIKEDLHFWASGSYIKLVAKKDKTQLFFTDDRYPSEQIILKYEDVLWYKKRDEERLHAMQNFVLNTTKCRMIILANYFGQQEKENCGVCDVCNPVVVKVDFKEVQNLVDTALANKESETFENIIGHLYGEERIQTMQLIRKMIGEGIYKVTATGAVSRG